MKYTYTVQTNHQGSWLDIIRDTRDFCLGYLHARKDYAPRNAYRLIRSDGKVMQELPALEDVAIGQVASWPSAEQYEAAAQRAMVQAARIREHAAMQEAKRAQRLANAKMTNGAEAKP